MKKFKRRFLKLLVAIAAFYGLLLIPDLSSTPIHKASAKAFSWNRDQLWLQLESEFATARNYSATTLDSAINKRFARQELLYAQLRPGLPYTDTSFHLSNRHFFSLAALVAAKQIRSDSFIRLYNKIRRNIKLQTRHWDMNDQAVRDMVYQQLYGMRAAVEEVILQAGDAAFDPSMLVTEELSATPATNLFGIRVHSGDLLVSRGGAEVSALISRGNDYPGNFSHVALIYVNEQHNAYLVEAHIEKGVAISTAEEYRKDKKLRFMVLRPAADLPSMKHDPELPHKAARLAYDEAQNRHIPYDFKMNFQDSSAMFCSEVGSYAYRKKGIQLWQASSTISSQGIVNWLHAFGVENFVTQMPSDLEYDSQLSIVGEWRDAQTLYKDHIDNAVMDVLLEAADRGRPINYSLFQLPLVRVIKGWCTIQNYFGRPALIPEGMTATQALKNQEFVAMYNSLKEKTLQNAEAFTAEKQYRPPYWQLVNIARKALNE